MNNRKYRAATNAPEGTKVFDVKLQCQDDVRQIVRETQGYWFQWLARVAKKVQAKALARYDGNPPPGMFETIASDVAKQFKFGAGPIQLVGFVAALAGDAVQALMDLWAQELLDLETIGNNDLSNPQLAFLERGRQLRAAKNWIGRVRGFGIITKTNADRATNYRGSLSPILRMSEVEMKSENFKAALLCIALHTTFDAQTSPKVAEQVAKYVNLLKKDQSTQRARGNTKYVTKADEAIVNSILACKVVFEDKKETTTQSRTPIMAPETTYPVTKCEYCREEVHGDPKKHQNSCSKYADYLIKTLQPATPVSKEQKAILDRSTSTKKSVRPYQGGLPSLNKKRR